MEHSLTLEAPLATQIVGVCIIVVVTWVASYFQDRMAVAAPLKDGVPNECNWKLRHYKHGEWTFGPCKLDVAESISERVVWNESIVATRNGAPLVWQRVSDLGDGSPLFKPSKLEENSIGNAGATAWFYT